MTKDDLPRLMQPSDRTNNIFDEIVIFCDNVASRIPNLVQLLNQGGGKFSCWLKEPSNKREFYVIRRII